jgi:DNA-binding response OmpR family regulator
VAVASILISEVDPDVRRLLVVLIERLGHVAAVLPDDVVVPPRADLLIVDPVAPAGVEHVRLIRAFFPEQPVLCLNPLPEPAGLLGRGPTSFLPKPFSPERLGAAVDRALSRAAAPV